MTMSMKNPNLKRLISGLLAFLMAVSATVGMVSCGESEENPGNNDGTRDETQADETLSVYDQLEKEKFNRTFTILNRSDMKDDFDIEALTSDVLDDSVYERNSVIERDYGVTFEYFYQDGYDAVNTQISTQVNGGLDEYDIAIGHKYTFTNCAQNNYLLDLGSVETMNLKGEWWDAACYNNLSVEGKVFLMTGDILPSSMLISACFVFNKKLAEQLNKQEPYDLVKEGKWTLDVLNEMTADVTIDLDGDSKIDYKTDRFGLTSWMMDVSYSMFYGANGMFVTINEGGLPELTYDAENVTDIYAKMFTSLITQQAYYVTDPTLYNTTYDVFTEGRALFCDITLHKISSFISDMKDDYGILPTPKYDELQKEYLSFVNGSSGFICMLNTEKDADFVGTIVDAMGAYNYVNLSPKMFEIVTKLKSARDPQSSEMVDYIIRNRVYDFGYFFDLGVTNVIRTQLMSKKENLTSALRGQKKSSEKALSTVIEAFQKGST